MVRSAKSLTAIGGASEAVVGAVAERRGLGPFAAAEVDGLCLLRMVDKRQERRRAVGAIAERLSFGVPAGAPEIWAALLDLQFIGSFLGHVRFRVIKIVGHWESSQWVDAVSDRLENHRRHLRRVSVSNKHGGMHHQAARPMRYVYRVWFRVRQSSRHRRI